MLRLRFISAAPALLVAAMLAACGFQPLYGRPGTVEALRAVAIQVEGRERVDHLVQEALYDRFGSRSTGGAYRLAATVSVGTRPMGVSADAIASRYVYSLSVRYTLHQEGVAAPLLRESAQVETSYDIPVQPYAALAARRAAEERAARDVAERVSLRVSRYLHDPAQP